MISSDVDVPDQIIVNHSEPLSKVKVVIIGAGIAGVTAAAKLYHNGVKDLVVLEAQDYIGGRIKAEVVDGKNIDIGAQFVHGQAGNPLYSIAEALGIVVAEDDGDAESTDVNPTLNSAIHIRLCSNGQKANSKEISSFCKSVEGVYICTDPATLDDEVTAGQIYTRAYNDYLREHGASLSSATKELLEASFRCLWTYTNVDKATDDLTDLNGWASLMYNELKGSRYTELYGGMTIILQAILDLLPEWAIQKNTPVIGVKWEQKGGLGHKSYATVICENGRRFEADHVIITMSLGCLMNGMSMFEPPLPSSFTRALKGLQLGVTGKIYIQWELPFWDRDAFNDGILEDSVFDFLWLKSCPVKIKSDRSKKLTQIGKPWWEGLVGCELIHSHDNILEFWFTGDQVRILEQLSDDEVMSVLHELLQIFFNKPNIPRPIGIYRSRWLSNPYVGGTYTYPNPSLQRCDVDVLSKPIPSLDNPRLLFAGEAYCLETIGSAHGAYMSGESKAEIILKTMGTETSKFRNVLDLIQERHHSN